MATSSVCSEVLLKKGCEMAVASTRLKILLLEIRL